MKSVMAMNDACRRRVLSGKWMTAFVRHAIDDEPAADNCGFFRRPSGKALQHTPLRSIYSHGYRYPLALNYW